MTHHIVGAADQLLFAKTTDLDKVTIDKGDIALQIGHGDDADIGAVIHFSLGNGLIVAHGEDSCLDLKIIIKISNKA